MPAAHGKLHAQWVAVSMWAVTGGLIFPGGVHAQHPAGGASSTVPTADSLACKQNGYNHITPATHHTQQTARLAWRPTSYPMYHGGACTDAFMLGRCSRRVEVFVSNNAMNMEERHAASKHCKSEGGGRTLAAENIALVGLSIADDCGPPSGAPAPACCTAHTQLSLLFCSIHLKPASTRLRRQGSAPRGLHRQRQLP